MAPDGDSPPERGAPGPLIVLVQDDAMAERAARAAASLGVPLTLLSAPSAAAHGGVGWFSHLAKGVAARHPDPPLSWIIDCGDRTGTAWAAIEAGAPAIVFTGDGESAARVARAAAARGVDAMRRAPPALLPRPGGDLVAACREWLSR